MNRDCIVTVLGLLVNDGVISLPAADHYLRIIDKVLEDGTNLNSIEDVLGIFNE